MSSSRKGSLYKGYVNATKGGPAQVPIPDSTWRRWLKQGKITVEQLKDIGITPYKRKRKHQGVQSDEENGRDNILGSHNAQENACTSSQSGNSDSEEDRSSDSSSSSNPFSSTSSSDSSASDSDESDSDSSDESDVSDEGLQKLKNIDLFKVLNSKFIGPNVLNQPLHPSLDVSKFEVLLMILHLSMRHEMTDVFLQHILDFVDEIVGKENSLGMSAHLFKKLFQFGRKPTKYYYCPHCNIILGTDKTCSEIIECRNEECTWRATTSSHNDGFFFLTLGIREQLHDVLSKPGLKFVSKKRLDRVVSDIMDGKEYKSQSRPGRPLSDDNALTVTISGDSSPVFKSGPNCLWPIHFYINEIEPSKRFASDNIMLAALWFGKSDPVMEMFFDPIVKEFKELEKTGIVWRKPCGTVVESRIHVMCCCADSVGRPKLQNHMQFNGSFACTICLHPNTNIEVLEKIRKKTVRKKKQKNKRGGRDAAAENNETVQESQEDLETYKVTNMMRYLRGEYVLRTDKTLREHMKLASVSPHPHVYGSRGMSVLFDLRNFNVVHGFAIDYMHALLLGTTKRLVNQWFDSTSSGEPYYIGSSIGNVDERIEDITLPSGFRAPRPISDRVHWKAHEWRAFLLYFGLLALMNILPLKYYNHFRKLVVAVYILSKDSILHDEIDSAHRLLQDFVWEYQDLYGQSNMVYNVHITGHMAEVVAAMGPLWAFSAFPFESANGRLLKLAKGTKGVSTQIGRKFLMTKSATKLLLNGYKAEDSTLKFCCNLIGCKYLQNSIRGSNNETMLGKLKHYELSDAQQVACQRRNISVARLVSVVNRVVVGGVIYHGRATTRQKKANDSCVRLISGEYALIDLILACNANNFGNADTYFIITKLNIGTDPSPLLVSHIKQCSLEHLGAVEVISSSEISTKCIFYKCCEKYYVSEFTNFFESD